jgi:hypothetical protein
MQFATVCHNYIAPSTPIIHEVFRDAEKRHHWRKRQGMRLGQEAEVKVDLFSLDQTFTVIKNLDLINPTFFASLIEFAREDEF